MVPEDNAHHHLPEQHHPVLVWFLMFLYTSTMGCIWVMDGGVSQGFAPWHRDWIRRCVWHLSAAGVFLSPQQAWLRCGAGGLLSQSRRQFPTKSKRKKPAIKSPAI